MEKSVPDIDQWISDSFPSIVVVDIVVVVVGLHPFLLSFFVQFSYQLTLLLIQR